MSRRSQKEPQFGLMVVVLIAVSAFSCGGGVCGLSGLFGSRNDPIAVAPRPSPPLQSAQPQSTAPAAVASTSSRPKTQASLPQSAVEVPTGSTLAPPSQSTPSVLLPKAESSPFARSATIVQPGDLSPKAQDLPMRAWASRDGSFSTSARFVALFSGKVRLNKVVRDEVVDVPIEQLSIGDRTYVGECVRVDTSANVIFGKVVGVADGDTLTVLDCEKQQHTIRLEGIDAPEGGQAFGSASKEALSAKVFGKTPWTEWRETDKYGRTLGHIYLDGRHINLEMVADGLAWHYKQYSNDPRLANAEVVARGKRTGLWNVNSQPTPPWEFRHPQPMPVEVQGLLDRTAPGQEPAVVYITRTGMSYHTAGCRFLAKSSIAVPLDDARTRYKPCSVCNPPR